MLRPFLLPTVLGLAATTTAQGMLTKHPVEAPVRDAGVLSWATGTWDRPGGSFANAPTSVLAFNNTCTWSGGAFFGGTYDCWVVYDEGRIPSSGDPQSGALPGVFDCQVICGFAFSYCTSAPSPFNAQIGFVQGLNTSGIGGRCAGVVQGVTPPQSAVKGAAPPANFGDANDLYVNLTGALPGSPAPPNQACWIVTIDLSTAFPNSGFAGAPFRADGDCVYEGTVAFPDNDFDVFNWTFEQKGNVAAFGAAGPVIVGGRGANVGAGTYGQPSGTNPFTGNPCGNGLGSFDNFWINTGPGVGPASCAAVGQPSLASGCYFFGGFPGNPWASWYLQVWTSGEDCSCVLCGASCGGGAFVYCTAKTSSAGCVSGVSFLLNGSPTTSAPVSGAGDWSIAASGVQGGKPGLMFAGANGPAMLSFSGGTLCMFPPLIRFPIQLSGGTGPNTCDGSYLYAGVNDGGAYNPNFDQGAGTSNWVQIWNRDPNNGPGTLGTQLSNAAEVTYQ